MEILVVEDDRSITQVVYGLLKDQEYDILWAPDVNSARQIISNRAVGAVLLDFHLPDGTALDVVHYIEENPDKRGLPVIIMTAGISEELVAQAQDCGIREFLVKPFTGKTLRKTIAKAIAREVSSGPVRTSVRRHRPTQED